jgi:uncharacterized protein (TIGR02246 family)
LDLNEVFTVKFYGPKMDASVGPYMLGRDGTVLNRRDRGIMDALIPRSDEPLIKNMVRELTTQAIEAGTEDGRLELVNKIARLVPVRLTGSYFGFPGPDDATMMRWSVATQNGFFKNVLNDSKIEAASVEAGTQMRAYISTLIAQRREELESRPELDDVVSRLLKMKLPESLGFDEERVASNIAGLLVGGVETTQQAIVQIIDQFLRRPDVMAKARAAAAADDDATLGAYVWEALRFNPINPFVPRITSRPHTLAAGTDRATTIGAGRLVFVSTQSAMHDEQELDAPEEFRIGRPPEHYMHFGYGEHVCLGKYVGMVEIVEVCKQILCLPNLRRASGAEGQIDFNGGFFPDSFVVEYGPAAACPTDSSGDPEAPMSQPLTRADIDDLNFRFRTTINAGDAAAAAALFTEDAYQLQPGFNEPFKGRAAITAMYEAWIAQTAVQYDQGNILDFGSQGDLGYQIVYQTNSQPKRDKTSGGLFITLLRRQPDGSWLIYAYISTV